LWKKGNRQEPATELAGIEASEAAFKAMARGKRVLHVAAHGFFLEGSCPAITEQTAVERREVTEFVPALAGENPLLLSGLALAGANHRDAAAADEEDGILTAEEVAALDLSGVEWAVLSACGTGLGQIEPGEGVFGLRRAFQLAGARTLIVSLWPVEDDASRRWMESLYRARFVEGQGTAEAVRLATRKQLEHRRDRGLSTHPFYWAGLVAAGDWR
jgi:CHAT domain-containing protein